jgi:hypothetical protein
METSIGQYVILCETLKKIELDGNYHPTDFEQQVDTFLLEKEEQQLSKSSKNMRRLND